jgi:hypothetical protein
MMPFYSIAQSFMTIATSRRQGKWHGKVMAELESE